MNILVIGSGGREHAIIDKLSESELTGIMYCAPGNAGTGTAAANVNLDISDHAELIRFVKEKNIGLTVVGPEQPLTDGIADSFNEAGILIFGPSKAAAEIESSKAFSKDLMRKYGIPTADYRIFTDHQSADSYVLSVDHPVVVKASGLAAGKGAVICSSVSESRSILKEMMLDKCFGKAGETVVIEEYLKGEEASVFAVCDGKNFKILAPAQDHKAAYDADRGPNTGGMGAYAPAPVVDPGMMERIAKDIIAPTVDAMRAEGREFKGVLFTGLMITSSGPKVIEYNCRFGDPETQVILPLLDADLADILFKAAGEGFPESGVLPVKNMHCLSLVLASGGYPGSYRKGLVITGIEDAVSSDADTKIIHAGTAVRDGSLVSSGGRVLNVVSLAYDLKQAKEKSYRAAGKIHFDGKYCRSDIGDKGIKYYG